MQYHWQGWVELAFCFLVNFFDAAQSVLFHLHHWALPSLPKKRLEASFDPDIYCRRCKQHLPRGRGPGKHEWPGLPAVRQWHFSYR